MLHVRSLHYQANEKHQIFRKKFSDLTNEIKAR